MSAPNDEGNPWLSLRDLLRTNVSIATLATAIEQFGIQTYDRFGRRIPATNEPAESRVSKAGALDWLAEYYGGPYNRAGDGSPDPDAWFESGSPLHEFGWPADEAPDFEKFLSETAPKSFPEKRSNMDAPVPARNRRTHLTIMAALCKSSGIDIRQRGAAQRIKEATEKLGHPVDDGTIQTMLKEIPEALDNRSK